MVTPVDVVFDKRAMRVPMLYREVAFGLQGSYQPTLHTQYDCAEKEGTEHRSKHFGSSTSTSRN